MSEEILKALAQLYAIITKQDGGVTEKEREFVISSFKRKLNLDTFREYVQQYDELVEYKKEKIETEDKKEKLTSVKDSVKTLALCKKINKTLTQKQKAVVLLELLELVKSDGNFTPQRMQIIDTVSTTFNIDKDEYKEIEPFVLNSNLDAFDSDNILIISSQKDIKAGSNTKFIYSEFTDGTLIFLRIKSVDMIFLKYEGENNIFLNGLELQPHDVALFSHGSIVKTTKGSCFYYSDIVSHFLSDSTEVKLSFNVVNVDFKFKNDKIGLRNINISEGPGKLIGIMGGSGAGKTTLLNVLAGLEKPSSGEVLVNDIDLHKEINKVKGVIGYISQDDLLIEELTVFENLYYNTKLCFSEISDEEITTSVNKVLSNLGLLHIKDLQVGSPLNKTISGGQRKRLNIALELIREPSVLFVDEPTSGLSSRDSENVIDLLKELSLKGTLVFVVIHQPSSDIYKMFDKMLILDTGGYLIFYGHPVDAITYFKRISKYADSEHGQCQKCGNVNPEQVFNIIEEKVVDEYGNFTPNRKVTPPQWNEYYKDNFRLEHIENIKDASLKILKIPSKIKQLIIFAIRDFKSKISNSQYIIINLIEAPLLATILSIIIRYNNDSSQSQYLFRYNENIPAYILMSIVVALFMGLSISAEEIIKDRKILRRELFLNLSRSSYLSSKILILFSFSAIQTFTFVLIGNSILEIKGMFFPYWLTLFSVACMANVLGLIISSGFKTAVTVYILIPLLLIPQMILSGAMFSFDKVNDFLKREDKVPIIADMMASRWAFEALSVHQFKTNMYELSIFDQEQIESISNFDLVYLLPDLKERLEFITENLEKKDSNTEETGTKNLEVIKNELLKQTSIIKSINSNWLTSLDYKKLKYNDLNLISASLKELEDIYQDVFNRASHKKDFIQTQIDETPEKNHKLSYLKDHYFNESLSELVRNAHASKRILEVNNKIIPKIDPVFFNPSNEEGFFSYRTHFFSPTKYFLGAYFETFTFNIGVIWAFTCFLYLFLYLNLLQKLLNFWENFKVTKSN